MVEVHIRSEASYKGGRIVGSIEDPESPPTTVFSIIVYSLGVGKLRPAGRIRPV